MNPKVGLQLVLASLLSTSILCTEAAEPQMNIYSWYDFIAPDATKNFHEETGIKAT
jgi:putrescine transport system substrate-binding protein